MRKIVVHVQMTLDGRISNAAGLFWEPFPFGDAQMSFVSSPTCWSGWLARDGRRSRSPASGDLRRHRHARR